MKSHLIIKITIIAFVFILIPSLLSTGKIIKTNKAEMNISFQAGGTDWKAPSFADKLKNPFTGDEKATKDGKSLYTINCASCHGNKGAGDGPASLPLNPKPKNLTSEVVQTQSDGAIFWKMTTGKGAMVSWKNTLTEKQRWSLVNYIRQLKKK